MRAQPRAAAGGAPALLSHSSPRQVASSCARMNIIVLLEPPPASHPPRPPAPPSARPTARSLSQHNTANPARPLLRLNNAFAMPAGARRSASGMACPALALRVGSPSFLRRRGHAPVRLLQVGRHFALPAWHAHAAYSARSAASVQPSINPGMTTVATPPSRRARVRGSQRTARPRGRTRSCTRCWDALSTDWRPAATGRGSMARGGQGAHVDRRKRAWQRPANLRTRQLDSHRLHAWM